MFENLLTDKLDIKFYKETNCYAFEIENFLSEEQYKALYENLPDVKISDFKKFNENYDKKDSPLQFMAFIAEGFTDKYNEFIYENPVMNEFVKKTMKNPIWIKRLMRKFYFKILKSRIYNLRSFFKLLIRINKPVDQKSDSLLNKFFYNEILCNPSFTYMTQDGQLMPHTDGEKKILSLMLYFPDENIPEEINNNLGTSFYDCNDFAFTSKDVGRKVSNFIESENFKKKNKISLTLPFKKKNLYGFIKSHKSWHSVEPRKVSHKFIRKTMIINLLLV